MPVRLKVFGPYDRFNYGDLLFPSLIRAAVERTSNNTYEFDFYSIVSTEIDDGSGIRTKSYRNLIESCAQPVYPHHNIVVAGGECLSATWDVLYGYINPFYGYLLKKKPLRRFLVSKQIARRFLGGHKEFPFCLDKAQFSTNTKILYDSVGGGMYLDPHNTEHAAWAARLRESDYIAVREHDSAEALKLAGVSNVSIAPDSAITVSDLYPRPEHDQYNLVRHEVRRIATSPYLVFQVSKAKSDGAIPTIVAQLDFIAEKTNLIIVLCPMGTASGHQDQAALRQIHAQLSCRNVLVHRPTIFEIMFILSRARLYIGTSLHGVITSMSYGVP